MFQKLLTGLLAAQIVGSAIGLIQVTNSDKPNQNGALLKGQLSPGYFFADPTSNVKFQPSAAVSVGNMSSFEIKPKSTVTMDPYSNYYSGSYSLNVFDSHCSMTVSNGATFGKHIPGGEIGRSEVYCNNTLTMGSNSYISMSPQTLLSVTSSLVLHRNIVVRMAKGSSMLIGNSLEIKDNAYLILDDHATLNVSAGSKGIVTITSSGNSKYTRVRLYASSKIAVDGSMNIGSGQATKVTLQPSGLLNITKRGSFSIQSSTFDIGPSSFWIIDGTFDFNDGSSLRSGLQSNITISTLPSNPKAGQFKTANGGDVLVGAGASMTVTGTALITGDLHLNSSSQFTLSGSLTTAAGGGVYLDSFAGLNINLANSLTMLVPGTTLTLGERSLLSIEYKSKSCILTQSITIPPYTAIILDSPNANHPAGLTCYG